MIGNGETWKEAFKLIGQYMLDGNDRLVRSELVDWHNAAIGDDGHRTWWTTIALYQLAFDQASLIPDANRAMYGKHILQYRGDLQRAVGVVSKASDDRSQDQGVYIKAHGSGTVWGGPYRTTSAFMSEWPEEIHNCFQYKDKIGFAYDSLMNNIYWFPHTLLNSINGELKDVRSVGISLDDVDEASRRYIQNGISSFAQGEAPNVWEVFNLRSTT